MVRMVVRDDDAWIVPVRITQSALDELCTNGRNISLQIKQEV
jgi:hypothetical protein